MFNQKNKKDEKNITEKKEIKIIKNKIKKKQTKKNNNTPKNI